MVTLCKSTPSTYSLGFSLLYASRGGKKLLYLLCGLQFEEQGFFFVREEELLMAHFSLLYNSANIFCFSESTSIPKNPRTDRPVGYAFVDLSTPSEAERAIAELSGKEILERKVSVQLARKPEPVGEKTEGAASGGEGLSGGEGGRRRASGRGRGRGRGRGGRTGRGGRVSSNEHLPYTKNIINSFIGGCC